MIFSKVTSAVMEVALILSLLFCGVISQPQAPLGEALDSVEVTDKDACEGIDSIAEGGDNEDNLTDLLEEYFQWKLHTYPEWATQKGFPGSNHLVEDFSMEAILAKGDKCNEFLIRSCQLPIVSVDVAPKDVMYRNIFETEVKTCVDGMKYKAYLLPPVNFLEGLQVEYPRLVSDKSLTPLRSLDDYEDLLQRITKLPKMVKQIQELLKEGVKEGVTYARESLAGTDRQFERLQVPANDSQFYERFRDMPGSLGRHVVDRMQTTAYNVVSEELLPALRSLQDYLEYTYSISFRKGPGVSNMENGDDFYKAVLQWHISTNLSPQQVHDIGLEEVEHIRTGVEEVIGLLGRNESFQEFSSQTREDPSQKFQSREEALKTYKDILTKRIQPQLSMLLPEDTLTDEVYSLGVSASPIGGPLAYYQGSSQDGTRSGKFYVSLDPLSSQKRFTSVTLSLHEGNPGHNYQSEFNKNLKGVPRFITNPMFVRYSEAPSRFPMNTAHVEGWGLYSEYLGFEMGLYETDLYARFGHYSFNLLRACRLVVDTGIHSMGWTRERAITYMLENTAMNRNNVEREVDRYITYPGQACAYKIGERKIKQLRKKASQELGDRFDVKEFHREILTCLAPLSVLEQCIEVFIEKVKEGQDDSNGPMGVPTPEVSNSGSDIMGGFLLLVLLLPITWLG